MTSDQTSSPLVFSIEDTTLRGLDRTIRAAFAYYKFGPIAHVPVDSEHIWGYLAQVSEEGDPERALTFRITVHVQLLSENSRSHTVQVQAELFPTLLTFRMAENYCLCMGIPFPLFFPPRTAGVLVTPPLRSEHDPPPTSRETDVIIFAMKDVLDAVNQGMDRIRQQLKGMRSVKD